MRRMVVTINPEEYRPNHFEATIKDGEETIFHGCYTDRDTVAYYKREGDNKPYVTDVLCQLKEQFHVDRLVLDAGEACCSKGNCKDVLAFDRNYLMTTFDLVSIKETGKYCHL